MFLYDMWMNRKKIIYIDESNISTNTGHSAYCAIFIFYTDKDIITKEIIYIESKLNIKHVHWVKMSWKSRLKFAKRIANLNFSCRVSIYINPINQENALEKFISEIVSIEDGILKIIIDGKKGDRYIHKLKKSLKSKNVTINRLLFVDDKSEGLIRLADFIAGLVRSHVDNQNTDNTYMFNVLKHKIKILN